MSFALWRDRLVLAILALLPWQARYIKEPAELLGAPWEQGTASIFALDILILAALGCHLLATSSRCEPRKSGAPLWVQVSALIPLYAFVSIAWAYDTIGALFSAIHLFEGYALAFLIWVSCISLSQGLAAFLSGVVATSGVGLWQSFTQETFSSSWLGVAAHPVQEAGVSVVETAGGRFLRAYGTLPHPNVLGAYAAAGLVAAFALAAEASGRFRKFLPAASGIAAAALVASYSRSSWLALAAALGIGFLAARALDKAARFRLRPALAAAVLCAGLVVILSWPVMAARLTGVGRLETRSLTERSDSLVEGYGIFKAYIEIGTGIGNYLPTTFLEYGFPPDPFAVQPPHLVPLLVGAELGFFGLAVLLGFVVIWWHDALWLLRRSRSPRAAFAAVLPVVVIVVSCFDHFPYDLFAGTLLTGASFGLFLKASEETPD